MTAPPDPGPREPELPPQLGAFFDSDIIVYVVALLAVGTFAVICCCGL